MASKSQSVKEVSAPELVATPSGSFSSAINNQCPYCSTYIFDSLDHVVDCAQTTEGGASSTLSSPPDSPSIKQRSILDNCDISHSSSFLIGSRTPSNIVQKGYKYEETQVSRSLHNANSAKIFFGTGTESQLRHQTFHAACFTAANLTLNPQKSNTNKMETAAHNTKKSTPLSPYVYGEYVHYEYSEDDDCEESSTLKAILEENNLDQDVFISTSQEANRVVEIQGSSLGNTSPRNKVSVQKLAGESRLSIFNQTPTTLDLNRISPVTEDNQSRNMAHLESESYISNRTFEEEYDDADVNESHTFQPKKKIRLTFKKLTPPEVIEQYLSNAENLPYEELYRRTANVAILMTKLQDEARMIDKQINDFEIARKSDQQIAVEEAKLEKEKTQREDDAIFGRLLRKYGSFTRVSVDEWTDFHGNFYENHLGENPDIYRLVLLLRNPQYINDFHKRTAAREKARLRSNTVKLANTIDPPPSKMEQKAMEDSDRKKRKPAIDPLVFEDRKMADVYGLTHKVGDAFIGNQPLKYRSEMLKDTSLGHLTDDNCRPKRIRKRGNCDTDQSDHTPAVSDGEEVIPSKRTRSTRALGDLTASPRASTRTASSSRESTPGTGPKVFASGKRVGRPPGSKTQVKLPSKLKSVLLKSDIPV